MKVKETIQKNGLALKKVSQKLKDDQDIVL
jgi:hypothetical protein